MRQAKSASLVCKYRWRTNVTARSPDANLSSFAKNAVRSHQPQAVTCSPCVAVPCVAVPLLASAHTNRAPCRPPTGDCWRARASHNVRRFHHRLQLPNFAKKPLELREERRALTPATHRVAVVRCRRPPAAPGGEQPAVRSHQPRAVPPSPRVSPGVSRIFRTDLLVCLCR